MLSCAEGTALMAVCFGFLTGAANADDEAIREAGAEAAGSGGSVDVLTDEIGAIGTKDGYRVLLFEEKFAKTRLSPADLGFVDFSSWESRGGVFTASVPGDGSAKARFTTRSFAATRQKGPVAFDWALRLPRAPGAGRHVRDVVSVTVMKEDRNPQYELTLSTRPRHGGSHVDYDFALKEWSGCASRIARGAAAGPISQGSQARFLRFRMVLEPRGDITVWLDNGTGEFQQVLRTSSRVHTDFGRLAFAYAATGTAESVPIEVDDLRVTAARGEALIVLAEALAGDPFVKSAMKVYRRDLATAGWNTEVMRVPPPSNPAIAARALKEAIVGRFRHGLAGLVIVGSDPAIPTVFWRHHVKGSGHDPADLFYADMDEWVDIDGDGVYESFDSKLDSSGQWVADESKPGNPANPRFYPKLFFGRIAAGPVAFSPTDEAARVAAYLARVHEHRARGSLLSPEQDSRALVFGEGEFQGKNQVERVSPAAPNLVGLFNRVVTSPERYAAELNTGYRFVTLMTHSSSDSHDLSMVENDFETGVSFTLGWLETTGAKVSYVNLFACGALNFTVPNFGATFLFKTNYTLNATGSVGGWGILPDAVYYEDLSAGIPIGIALRDYAQRTKNDGEVGWPKGSLHGDPLIEYRKPVPNKASYISSDTRAFRVAVGAALVRTIAAQDLENDTSVVSITGLPPGATFDGRTLSFTPEAEQEGWTFSLEAVVSEPGLPARYTESFAIEVTAPPSSGAVRNVGFEEGGVMPASWNRSAFDYYNAKYSWTDGMGRGGSKGVSIKSEQPNDASWIQRVQGLQPGRSYRLIGWLKADAAVAESGFGEAANLCLFGTWEHAGQSGTFDWTQVTLPFTAPDTGEVVVGCRLGYWSNTSTGQIWCDDLEIVPDR